MSWVENQEELQKFAQEFDKRIKLHTKDNLLSKVISWILFVISFGQLKRSTYMVKAATALANHHFFPKEWTSWQVQSVIPHEARHTKQLTYCGAGIHPLLGLPVAALIYGLLFFPVFFALGRFYFEYDADRTKYRYTLSQDNSLYMQTWVRSSAERRADKISGSMYLWAVPRAFAQKQYMKMAEEVINESTNMG